MLASDVELGYAVLARPGSLAILVTGWSGQGCTTSPSVPKEEDAFLGTDSESDEFLARPVLTRRGGPSAVHPIPIRARTPGSEIGDDGHKSASLSQ